MKWADSEQDFVNPVEALNHSFYVRAKAEKSAVQKLFGEVKYLCRENAPEGEIAFITDIINEKDFAEKSAKLDVLSSIRVLDY